MKKCPIIGDKGMARIKEVIAHALFKFDCHLYANVIRNHLDLHITPAENLQLSQFIGMMDNQYIQYDLSSII